MRFLLVGAGGFLGANARYLLSLGVSNWWAHSFPIGTMLINVTGSFVLALFVAYSLRRLGLPDSYRLLFTVGFLGSYTTFSTLTQETMELAAGGQVYLAAAYAGGSLVLGLLGATSGNALGGAL
ncbi:MAG: fluoride efflux transporter CrcB [Chloroflexota bacterium]|nr:fluoride efflux transporter CrcB [Chloroflexota bacterium]